MVHDPYWDLVPEPVDPAFDAALQLPFSQAASLVNAPGMDVIFERLPPTLFLISYAVLTITCRWRRS